MGKNDIFIVFFLLFLSVNFIHATSESSIKAPISSAQILVKTHPSLGFCSKSLQNCTIQVSQNGCFVPPGSVSITNSSQITAMNITASSSDSNFTTYVVQNNGCPSSLSPGASCTISFYTNTPSAFTVSNVTVQGSNTNATTFDMNVVLCPNTYIVTPNGDGNETISPNTPQTVNFGASQSFTVTANAGFTLSSVVGGTCPAGSWLGSIYTTGAITNSCTVNFSVATAPAAPTNVTATPGNTQATINWVAPTNTGGTAIIGYTVTYGFTNSSSYTRAGCTTTGALSCTVPLLENGSAYTFLVTATNSAGTSAPAFSSSVTPTAGLSALPSTLALSGLGSGALRTTLITNNSPSSVTIDSVSAASPALPGSAVVNTASVTDCTRVGTLAAGASCTVTVDPGVTPTSTSGCTTGAAVPTPSVITVATSGGSINANILILGYGCQYQGGYVFSIDDTVPTTGSIGGTVAALQDQTLSQWGPDPSFVWGTNQTSTTTSPSPSSPSATLIPGQVNCNANTDGYCTTNNMVIAYTRFPYAANVCSQTPMDSAGNVPCQIGNTCYTDWYLPAICQMGYDYNNLGSTCGPSPGIIQNMQYSLIDSGNGSAAAGLTASINYFSSTSLATNFSLCYPAGACAWVDYFEVDLSQGGGQSITIKDSTINIRCVRTLTY